jgi:hypothetical protein
MKKGCQIFKIWFLLSRLKYRFSLKIKKTIYLFRTESIFFHIFLIYCMCVAACTIERNKKKKYDCNDPSAHSHKINVVKNGFLSYVLCQIIL